MINAQRINVITGRPKILLHWHTSIPNYFMLIEHLLQLLAFIYVFYRRCLSLTHIIYIMNMNAVMY